MKKGRQFSTVEMGVSMHTTARTADRSKQYGEILGHGLPSKRG